VSEAEVGSSCCRRVIRDGERGCRGLILIPTQPPCRHRQLMALSREPEAAAPLSAVAAAAARHGAAPRRGRQQQSGAPSAAAAGDKAAPPPRAGAATMPRRRCDNSSSGPTVRPRRPRCGRGHAGRAWWPLLLLALAAAAGTRQLAAAAGALDITWDGRPTPTTTPVVTFSWPTPTKAVWPSTLTYTATATGTAYYTVTVNRVSTISGGVVTGSLLVQRTAGDTSGGSDKILTANTPVIELWQANGPEAPMVKLSQTNCVWETAAPTYNFNTPGTSTKCTYTFSPSTTSTSTYDLEQPAQLRVAPITITAPPGLPPASGFTPWEVAAYPGQIPAPNRCAIVTDTMTFATSADRPNPYNAANTIMAPFQGSGPKPPATPSTGVEICATTIFRYTAQFPSATCATWAYYVSLVGVWMGGGGVMFDVVGGG
jgi:hypothetical protein